MGLKKKEKKIKSQKHKKKKKIGLLKKKYQSWKRKDK